MTRVIVSKDCGNSPKNIFLQKLTIAFAKGDSKFIFRNVTDNIRWDIVGNRLIEGKEDFFDALDRIKTDQIVQLNINHVPTHGKAGAVDGTKKQKNGKTFAFCDVYEFHNTIGTSVREIISYVIEIK